MEKNKLMNKITMKLKLAKMLFGSLALIAAWNTSGQYALKSYTIDGGGGTCGNGPFVLSGTIGQPDASRPMTGGGYSLIGGFWADDSLMPAQPFLSIARSGSN